MRLINRTASHQPSSTTIVLAAIGAVGVLAILTIVALIAPRGVPGLNYYEIKAQFDDASQIADLSEVRIAGRHVGQVTGSDLSNGKATVELQLFPGEGPLPADTTARIRLKGLLGAKFVDVSPGRSEPGAAPTARRCPPSRLPPRSSCSTSSRRSTRRRGATSSSRSRASGKASWAAARSSTRRCASRRSTTAPWARVPEDPRA